MVTLQILVLPFKVRILVGQLFKQQKPCKSITYGAFCLPGEGMGEGKWPFFKRFTKKVC